MTLRGINLKEATDDQLMQAAAEGKVDAFGEIILRHQHAVWKVAYRFLGDSMEAEDAARRPFSKSWKPPRAIARRRAFAPISTGS